jgi:TRAP-type uncharacterized transport system substrate-binding protein
MRFGTSAVGTWGYKVASMQMAILAEEFPAHYEFIVFPYPSSTASMIGSMHGGVEAGYVADISMAQMVARTGPFTGLTPRKAELVHTLYFGATKTPLAVLARDAHLYKSWADLSGVPTFFMAAGTMNYLHMKKAFRELGYDFRHVEVGFAAVPDALAAGTIKAAAVVTLTGPSVAPWVMELDLRTDITILNPTPAERAKMTAAGVPLSRINPDAFIQDVGVPEIWGLINFLGFGMRPDISQEFVYNMLTAFYRRRADLYRLERGFVLLNEDFVGLQVTGIKMNPDIPVHPGLHQFLVEKGAWNPAWTVAS